MATDPSDIVLDPHDPAGVGLDGVVRDTDPDAAPVVRLVNGIIGNAISMGASDIHLEPVQQGTRVRFRMDGLLVEQMTCPLKLGPALTSRVKVMARLDLAERRLPQDGTMDVRLGDKTVHFRVSVLPTGTGERMVLRVLDKASYVLDLERLGFQADDLDRIRRAIEQPTGLILVTGPKGAGVRSLLYSLLTWLNNADTCILTAENPIEINLDGIGQVQVKEELGYTYAAALSAFMAQDPDAVMVQELREAEVARMAVEIALEQCRVLTSVPAGDSGEAIRKVVELGVQPVLLGAATRLIIAQRGIRKLCPDCRVGFSPSREQLETAGVLKLARREGAGGLAEDLTLYRPGGCARCGERGYRGRLLVYEILEATSQIRDAISSGLPSERIRQLAIENGMVTMAENAWRRALEGQTSLEECLKVM